MSHFSVLHIGLSVENDFAPYCEHDENYHQHVDETEEYLADFEKYGKGDSSDKFKEYCKKEGITDPTIIEFLAYWTSIDKVIKEGDTIPNDRYILLDKTGKVSKIFGHYNPNAKWDCYQIGGRWSNEILKKDGTKCDTCMLSEVDFKGMLQESIDLRTKRWNEVHKALGGSIPTYIKWSDYVELVHNGKVKDIETARKLYHAQEAVQLWDNNVQGMTWVRTKKDDIETYMLNNVVQVSTLPTSHEGINSNVIQVGRTYYVWARKVDCIGYMASLEDFDCTLEAYTEQASLPFYAFNVFGDWFAEGEMGWWGMDTKNMTRKEWNELMFEKVEELLQRDDAEEIEVSMVDCHI